MSSLLPPAHESCIQNCGLQVAENKLTLTKKKTPQKQKNQVTKTSKPAGRCSTRVPLITEEPRKVLFIHQRRKAKTKDAKKARQKNIAGRSTNLQLKEYQFRKTRFSLIWQIPLEHLPHFQSLQENYFSYTFQSWC